MLGWVNRLTIEVANSGLISLFLIFSSAGTLPKPSSDNFTVGLFGEGRVYLPGLLGPGKLKSKPEVLGPKRFEWSTSLRVQSNGSSDMLESTSSSSSVLIFSGLSASFSLSFSSNWVVEDSSATWKNGLVVVCFFFLVAGGNPLVTPAANELIVCLGILSATCSLRFLESSSF